MSITGKPFRVKRDQNLAGLHFHLHLEEVMEPRHLCMSRHLGFYDLGAVQPRPRASLPISYSTWQAASACLTFKIGGERTPYSLSKKKNVAAQPPEYRCFGRKAAVSNTRVRKGGRRVGRSCLEHWIVFLIRRTRVRES